MLGSRVPWLVRYSLAWPKGAAGGARAAGARPEVQREVVHRPLEQGPGPRGEPSSFVVSTYSARWAQEAQFCALTHAGVR
jgi:hypothetical protein